MYLFWWNNNKNSRIYKEYDKKDAKAFTMKNKAGTTLGTVTDATVTYKTGEFESAF